MIFYTLVLSKFKLLWQHVLTACPALFSIVALSFLRRLVCIIHTIFIIYILEWKLKTVDNSIEEAGRQCGRCWTDESLASCESEWPGVAHCLCPMVANVLTLHCTLHCTGTRQCTPVQRTPGKTMGCCPGGWWWHRPGHCSVGIWHSPG